MNPLYFLSTAGSFFWLGVLIQRGAAQKRIDELVELATYWKAQARKKPKPPTARKKAKP